MKNRGIDKVVSAAGVILFVGLIRTEASFGGLAALTLVLYEICLWVCRIAHKEARRNRRRHYITATKLDMERVADQVFNPLKEVS